MNCIPKKLKDEMSADPYYKRCCISGSFENIQFHHAFCFAGRQLQEKWCILPLSKDIHDNIDTYREKCNWIMLNRATDEQLKKYSRAEDLIAKRDRLNKKYSK